MGNPTTPSLLVLAGRLLASDFSGREDKHRRLELVVLTHDGLGDVGKRIRRTGAGIFERNLVEALTARIILSFVSLIYSLSRSNVNSVFTTFCDSEPNLRLCLTLI